MRIEDMPAGPELDALVGMQVMALDVKGITLCLRAIEWTGYEVPDYEPAEDTPGAKRKAVYLSQCACDIAAELQEERKQWKLPDGRPWPFAPDRRLFGHYWGCLEVVPDYSEDIAAAWQVVEKMRGNDITIRIWKNGTQYVSIDTPSDHSSTVANDSIPRAICRAALLACGVTEVSKEALPCSE